MSFPTTTISTTVDAASSRAPFAGPFPSSLPRGLRDEARALPSEAFHAKYAPSSGSVRLRNWECLDAAKPGPQARRYQATIAVGDRIGTCVTAASGPLAALTAMLHDRGVAVEMLQFHQVRAGDETATFIRATDGRRQEWAMGWDRDATESALRAVLACANRLCE
ncbi:homocitrate synthase [Mycobacterium hodleri]|uniref:homocitrate synthase n=1 Tax=Mycolicibacterium hodleri TaxID=49897 RepID=UPI0021F27DE1|nr:homocitrate synthase [Mycolicibacterium hodleri]MCV7135015.1 homocitrate synthase [Mycolicibacterium hodleri]